MKHIFAGVARSYRVSHTAHPVCRDAEGKLIARAQSADRSGLPEFENTGFEILPPGLVHDRARRPLAGRLPGNGAAVLGFATCVSQKPSLTPRTANGGSEPFQVLRAKHCMRRGMRDNEPSSIKAEGVA